MPRSARRAATRRPVLPVAPRTRIGAGEVVIPTWNPHRLRLSMAQTRASVRERLRSGDGLGRRTPRRRPGARRVPPLLTAGPAVGDADPGPCAADPCGARAGGGVAAARRRPAGPPRGGGGGGPPWLVLPAAYFASPLVPLLEQEIAKDEPGQEAVLDRLLDLLLIAVLRAWFARPEADAPGWYRASGDAVVGHALRLLHNSPARPWTVGELARETGVSRAALARRFHALVGEPPMTFLTSWRIALAADLLREPGATIASVAHQVGYSTPFA